MAKKNNIKTNKESKVTTVNREQEQYKKRRNEALQGVDILKMYFMKPYSITDKIVVYQPTIGQILSFGENDVYGEKEFYGTVNIFVSNTTSYRLQLWDMNIDWNKISDYELFSMLISGINDDVQKILFHDVNLKLLKPYAIKQSDASEQQSEETNDQTKDSKTNENNNAQQKKALFTLYDPKYGIELNEESYIKLARYLRVMFNIFPKVEFAKGKSTKLDLINEERQKLAMKEKNGDTSILFPLISACVNHPGFKYKIDEIEQMGIVQFMDCVQRLQVYENSNALLHGSFSGFVDTKGINKEEFNFMRDMYQ